MIDGRPPMSFKPNRTLALDQHEQDVRTVLPRPIWSARMPLRPFWCSDMSHLTPFSWYVRISPTISGNISCALQ